VKEEISGSEGHRDPVTKMVGDKINRTVQRTILGLCEVPGGKYSRRLPSIFEGRPVDLLKIVITEEIGIRHSQVWDSYHEKDNKKRRDALYELTLGCSCARGIRAILRRLEWK
jgi:hypothetical protein